MTEPTKFNDTVLRVVCAAFALAAIAGATWLIGVQQRSTMLQANHAREAFAALKRAAGPRMQVRKVEISSSEMSVAAYDPDMPDWRWLSNSQRRSGPGHWYSGQGVKEQSWRVSYWTAFGHDWYRVRGPIVEGIIQQNEGPAFDLRPDDIVEPAELQRRAVRDATIQGDACARLVTDGRIWTLCERYGDPTLVSVRAHVPSRDRPKCPEPQSSPSGSGIDEGLFSRLFGCHGVN